MSLRAGSAPEQRSNKGKRMRGFRPFLLAAATASAGVFAAGAVDARPKTYSPAEAGGLATRCSARYGAPVYAPDIPAGSSAERVVIGNFRANPTFGFPRNVRVEADGSSGAGYLSIAYPKGSVAPSVKSRPTGGLGFYARGRLAKGTDAACLRYLVRFPGDFDFRSGGKLPGLFGGANPPSGGDRPRGDTGFTVRLMWRGEGKGELYVYAPNMVPDSAHGGMQLGTGSFRFPRGRWVEVEVETILNAPGESDGLIHLWIDGKPEIFVKGVKFRKSGRVPVGGLMFSTFFGGDTARFAAAKAEHVDFSGFRVYGAPREDALNRQGG